MGTSIHTARELNEGPIAHRDLVHTHVPKLRVGVALYTDPLREPGGGCHYPERARAVSLSHGHVILFAAGRVPGGRDCRLSVLT